MPGRPHAGASTLKKGLRGRLAAYRAGALRLPSEAVANGTVDQLYGFALTLAHKTSAELSIMRVEVFLGILIGATYVLASRTLESSGQLFDLTPWIVGWLPAAALAAFTAVMLTRVR